MNQPAYPNRAQTKNMESTSGDSRSRSASPELTQDSLPQTQSQPPRKTPNRRRRDHSQQQQQQQAPPQNQQGLVPGGVGGGNPLEGVSSQATELLGNTLGSVLGGGGKAKGGGQKEALKLRLDLNLEVDVHITAKIHGDVTLSLFS